MKIGDWVPVTPGGTIVVDCAASTKEAAIEKLLKVTAHMPYGEWKYYKARGYTIEEVIE